MRTFLLCLLLLSVLCFGQNALAPYDAVSPFIGTAADGNTFPAASLPFGMMQWGPDTRADGWYHYADKTIRGFSLTHISGAGCPIYADVPILPWSGELPRSASAFGDSAMGFSHDSEEAHPGYYKVRSDNGIETSITVAMRAGIGRFGFPAGAPASLILKAGDSATIGDEKRKGDTSSVEIRGNDTVAGTVRSGGFCSSDSNYTLYFVAKFSRPIASSGTWSDDVHPGGSAITGHRAGAYVSFSSSEPVLVKVGISFVSVDNAAANLQAEIPGWDFDAVQRAAKSAWVTMFDRVNAEGGTAEQRKIFYTGVYHMLLAPNVFSDSNGDYIGFDGKVRRLKAGETQYANFSDWDTYRSLIQFHALLLPGETSQMMQSLVRDAEQSGWLPRWPVANDVSYVMGGDSSAILLASAHALGARKFDTKSALEFMVKGATHPGTGPHGQSVRPFLSDYLGKGYIPAAEDRESAASVTLEYASADFAISRFAAAMGDEVNAARLLRSSQNWKNLFDPESGFIRPRLADGKFVADWDPDNRMPRHKGWDTSNQFGFEEGSTWQYTWMIPHNYGGLFGQMGGVEKALPKLDKFFQKLTGWGVPTFTVTNEPDFCAPYVYVWAGQPWKTQEVVDRIRRETFTTKPDGLPGNDDLGATSGVYVWNAAGMYPVIPGIAGFVLGTPMFPRLTIRFGDGRELEIVAKGEGIYVQDASLNGKSFDGTWLALERLRAGHNRLEFKLGTQPNHSWATHGTSERPPSFEEIPR